MNAKPIDRGLTDMIVIQLARHRSRDAIIRTVCEEHGLKWSEAEELIYRVEEEEAPAIARRQGRWALFLSVGYIAIGGVMLYVFDSLMAQAQGIVLGELLGRRTALYAIASGLLGGSLTVWGLIGLWRRARMWFGR